MEYEGRAGGWVVRSSPDVQLGYKMSGACLQLQPSRCDLMSVRPEEETGAPADIMCHPVTKCHLRAACESGNGQAVLKKYI